MMRRWARGLLAFLVCFSLLQSGFAAAMDEAPGGIVPGDQAAASMQMELQPGTLSAPKMVESSAQRLQQTGKRDQRFSGTAGGDDALALLLLVAIAAFLAPLFSGAIGPVFLPAALRPISRPVPAGRCPTGPPALA